MCQRRGVVGSRFHRPQVASHRCVGGHLPWFDLCFKVSWAPSKRRHLEKSPPRSLDTFSTIFMCTPLEKPIATNGAVETPSMVVAHSEPTPPLCNRFAKFDTGISCLFSRHHPRDVHSIRQAQW
ncbi:hypothetical protein, variant 3 [Aphanomyces invadans]|nr:hypothetical protein, variant 1 [Aphanomyces invadans]XP_008869079.1 hypothetical protein, variant 2 [Aphanomyces invadans]XP_008869080.1 hypothetical protein, variant 3 [Aphanomyces invadans]ETW02473.1 hypothetical protein, variant 1 [Aphanomyces invadans]ETW02474.1 hypothetical protein, variant 2 [Aphanomyces invadans]ETW02475.1 hypothetical protein, variant 3 [Aphanomyces invadans]|eukprot:XP_008869078.1 hypothetical protein, variant 1 [Aphanomyces invadans]